MAKPEEKVPKSNNKKSKAKKRKHTSTENDDEIASKSLIVESEKTLEDAQGGGAHGSYLHSPTSNIQNNSNFTVNTTKSLKRKNKTKENKIKQKRSKQAEDTEEDNDYKNEAAEQNDNDEQQLHEPTLQELRDSDKPENTKAIITVRQKKKQKHQERLEAQQGQSVGKEKQRNAEYLQKWKNSKIDWKFEKLRQISIQQSMFEEDKLDADIWPIALEYLSGSKGAAQDKISKLAEKVIDQVDVECEKLDDDNARQILVDSVRYQRARELLQSFD